MIRIILINPINNLAEVETRYPNLGFGYLASALRMHFGEQEFVFQYCTHELAATVKKFKPDIAFITSVTQNYEIAKTYAESLKKIGIPVIIGGIHVSTLPQTLTSHMDIACIGEGEKTIVDLLSLFRKNGRFDPVDALNIQGLFVNVENKWVSTPMREQIADLDSIPLPARDLFSIHSHSYIFSSRGCPYRCLFCASSHYWQKLRFFSAEYVVREIQELIEHYDVKLISFFDDLFIANVPRLKSIVGLLEKGSLLHKVKFTCSARANLVNEEVVALLKRMHVVSVGMGLESGASTTLKYLKGPAVTVEDNRNAVSLLHKNGIAANASFVIGAPNETREDILKTYHFIKNNPVSLFDIYVLTPYPGTEIWDYAKKRNLVSEEMNWNKLNVNFQSNCKDAVLVSEKMDRKELLELFQKFRMLRLLRNIAAVWTTPQLRDLPLIILKTLVERFFMLLRKIGMVHTR